MDELDVSFPQSLPVCLLLAFAAGVADVVSAVAIAVPEYHREQGQPWSRWGLRASILVNIVCQVLQTVTAAAATFFGPVSLAIPTQAATVLVSNLIVFGSILKYEQVTKDNWVGTYNVVVAVVFLVIVGPQPQDDQVIEQLIDAHWYCEAWLYLLTILAVLSGLLMVCLDLSKLGKWQGIALFHVVFVTTEVMSNSASRAMALTHTWKIGLAIAAFVITTTVGTYGMLIQARHLPQTSFWPIQTMLEIAFNAITGLLVWEDWKAIVSPVGYVFCFFLLSLGVYLISDFDGFSTVQKQQAESFFQKCQRFCMPAQAPAPPSALMQQLELVHQKRYDRARQSMDQWLKHYALSHHLHVGDDIDNDEEDVDVELFGGKLVDGEITQEDEVEKTESLAELQVAKKCNIRHQTILVGIGVDIEQAQEVTEGDITEQSQQTHYDNTQRQSSLYHRAMMISW